METYVRFETYLRAEWASRALGVFRAAGVVCDGPNLPAYARETLAESFDWFNTNLAVPRSETMDRRAIFWFRSSAVTCIRRVWEIVAVLREESIVVRLFRTTRPGRIIYADEHQVAAIPTRR